MDVFIASSRHKPCQFLDAGDLRPVLEVKPGEFDEGVSLTAAAHLPGPDVVLGFGNDLTMRMWNMVETHMHTSRSLVCSNYISQMRVPDGRPGSVFGSTTVGTLQLYDVVRYHEPRLKATFSIHCDRPDDSLGVDFTARRKVTGDIITDFCLLSEHRAVTASFDQSLRITDLNLSGHKNHGTTVLGRSDVCTSHLDYSPTYQVIAAASMDNRVSAWVTHASHTPRTYFEDSAQPHKARIVGVSCPPDTPQVISVDCSGLMKVWDVRMFQCVQNLLVGAKTQGGPDDDADDLRTVTGEMEDGGLRRRVNMMAYVPNRLDVVTADSRGLTAHAYDQGADPSLADDAMTLSVAYNDRENTILTLTARDLGIWDAGNGVLLHHYRNVMKADVTVVSLDYHCRRFFIGTAEGAIGIWVYAGVTHINTIKPHTRDVTAIMYSEPHRAIISTSLDGSYNVFAEKDLVPETKVKLGTSPITCLTVSVPLQLIAVGTAQGRLFLADMTHPRVSVGETAPLGAAVRTLCVFGDPCPSIASAATHPGAPPKPEQPQGTIPLVAVGLTNGDIVIFTVRPSRTEEEVLRFSVSDKTKVAPGEAIPAAHRRGSADAAAAAPPANGAAESADFAPRTEALVATAMAFDPHEHVLWVGDSSGDVTGWRLCAIIHGLGLTPARFPETKVFDVVMPRRPCPPALHCKFKAHQEEVLAMELLQEHNAVLTTGDDRRACFWSAADGAFRGELSAGRIAMELRAALPAGEKAAAASPVRRRAALSRTTPRALHAPVLDFALPRGAARAVPNDRCRHKFPGRRGRPDDAPSLRTHRASVLMLGELRRGALRGAR